MAEQSQESLPPTWLSHVYPNATALFAVRLAPLHEVKDECLVVLDTNVLLTPYTIGPKSLDEIGRTYTRLVKEKRLRVPAQVAREFVKNRSQKLEELFQQLVRKQNGPRTSSGEYPLLAPIARYKEVTELEQQIDAKRSEYQKAMGELMDHVKGWTWNDPVSALYSELFDDKVVFEPSLDAASIETELDRRLRYRIPPGYKDGGKPDRGAGDLIIWLSILNLAESLKKHLLFVSSDEKADWWHRSEGQTLYPRFELAEEYFRRSKGKSFHIVRFSAMLDLYGAEQGVVEEVRQEEIEVPLTIPPEATVLVTKRQLIHVVAKWARRRYNATRMKIGEPAGPDLLIVDRDDESVGLVVVHARGRGLSMTIHRIREAALLAHWYRSKYTLTVAGVVIAADTISLATRLRTHLVRSSMEFPEVHIHLGVLEGHRYRELGEMRFSGADSE